MDFQSSIKDFIVRWNVKFPLDYYVRKKRGLIFNSEEHRIVNLIDICIEIEEKKLFSSIFKEKEKEEKNRQDYQNTGIWLGQEELEISDEEFENFDLEQFNDV